MIKGTQEKTFAVFMDFLQIAEVFHTNFISAILSTNIAKNCFLFLSKAKPQSFPYIMIKFNEPQNFCCFKYVHYTYFIFKNFIQLTVAK